MKVIDNMAEAVRRKVRSFLQIDPADGSTFYIKEVLDQEGNIFKNRIWYRGDADELDQFYKSLNSAANASRFWAAVPTMGMEIRKIHTGLPAMMVDVLSGLIISDMNDISIKEEKLKELWKEIEKENALRELIGQSIADVLVDGDGAFKITIDTDISQYPIIEFVTGDLVEYTYVRGRLREIVFKTHYKHNSNVYTLYEAYGYGYIKSELRRGDRVVPLNAIPHTEDVHEIVTFDNGVMLAKQLMFTKSNKWKGRGRSIYDSKTDAFDAFDECWSQWMEAVRIGRAKEYVPENMLPRNPRTGEVLRPNAFDNAYIQRDKAMQEQGVDKIDVVQPKIPHESYLATYVTALDQCLQGIISPSTLGIDVKKLDNAEAQREKEKTTLYTRNNIIDKLQIVIPELAEVAIHAYHILKEQPLVDVGADVTFGEYANPSFESQIETVAKGKAGGIMSIEASVEELYGATKDEKWKKEEVARLKAEQGLVSMDEMTVSEDASKEQIGFKV